MIIEVKVPANQGEVFDRHAFDRRVGELLDMSVDGEWKLARLRSATVDQSGLFAFLIIESED